MSIPVGRFVWYDLMTPDVKAGQNFYTEVVGWKLTPFEGSDPLYMMWTASDGETVGGAMELPEDAREMGAPPHWLSYVAVADVEGVIGTAQKLGGTLLKEPMTMPGVGTFAVIRDPQGGVISPFQPAGDMTAPESPIPTGYFSWNEMACDDWKANLAFYKELFGWVESDIMDMGGGNLYQMYKVEGMDFALGGFFNRMEEQPVSWLHYAKVADVEGAVERVKALGGTLLNGPMDVPDGGRVAQCMDAQGAAFALHSAKA